MTRAAIGCLILVVCAVMFLRSADAVPSCTVEGAVTRIEVDEMNRAAASATSMQPMLLELHQIAAKATDPLKPLVDQLSPRDAARFATISSQIEGLMVTDFVESAHARDASVVEQMWTAAWSNYLDPSALPAKANFAGDLTFVLRVLFPDPKLKYRPVQSGHCSVTDALALAEETAVRHFNQFGKLVRRDQAEISALRAKYGAVGGRPLDKSKMTPEDVHNLEEIEVELSPVIRDSMLTRDLQNIRDWWAMSNLVYRTRREAILTYGPHIRDLGKTIQPLRAGFDRRHRIMLRLWNKVDEKIKSDAVQNMEIMSKVMHSVRKIKREAKQPPG